MIKSKMIPVLKNLLPEQLSAGIIFYNNLSGCRENELQRFIQNELVAIRQSHSQALPAGYSNSRNLYRNFGIDPTKHRPSAEALWRRLRDKNDFPQVHPFVNLTNLLSLKFQVCYGLYDTEKIQGDVLITIGSENDVYQGLGKEQVNLNKKIALKDAQGPFGNPSSDSLRTSVTGHSRTILQVIFFLPQDPLKNHILKETCGTFREFFHFEQMSSSLI